MKRLWPILLLIGFLACEEEIEESSQLDKGQRSDARADGNLSDQGGADAEPPMRPDQGSTLGECAPGTMRGLECSDGLLVPWCSCSEAGVWDCLPNPESQCRDPRCDDEGGLSCDQLMPRCGAEEILSIQEGCWRCVDSESCLPVEELGCSGDLDCDLQEFCAPCAHSSCPDCEDCIPGCLPHSCSVELEELRCNMPRPECGARLMGLPQRGCWSCVDPRSCEPPPAPLCTQEGGACGFGCALNSLTPLDCSEGQECCTLAAPRDPRCDDGTEPMCNMLPPECQPFEILAWRDRCYLCVNPESCQPWGVPGCEQDLDCSAEEFCAPCASGSCPICTDCIPGCQPHGCPTEPEAACDQARPSCGPGAIAIIERGCWHCVLRESCEEAECESLEGICQSSFEPCPEEYSSSIDPMGCPEGPSQCCLPSSGELCFEGGGVCHPDDLVCPFGLEPGAPLDCAEGRRCCQLIEPGRACGAMGGICAVPGACAPDQEPGPGSDCAEGLLCCLPSGEDECERFGGSCASFGGCGEGTLSTPGMGCPESCCLPWEPGVACQERGGVCDSTCPPDHAADGVQDCEVGKLCCMLDHDPRCDDGSEPSCEMQPPLCQDWELLAWQRDCYRCVNPDTCRPWGEPDCRSHSDCPPTELCENCGSSSCPMCADCIPGCQPHHCPSEPEVFCNTVRPDCPEGQFALAREGCWLCVEEQSCEPPPLSFCEEMGGNCGDCGSGTRLSADLLGCEQRCCLPEEIGQECRALPGGYCSAERCEEGFGAQVDGLDCGPSRQCCQPELGQECQAEGGRCSSLCRIEEHNMGSMDCGRENNCCIPEGPNSCRSYGGFCVEPWQPGEPRPLCLGGSIGTLDCEGGYCCVSNRERSCDDGSLSRCILYPEHCEAGSSLALENGCYICINPATCRRWGERGCFRDLDCPADEHCDPCGTSSAPNHNDCLPACLEHGCETEPEPACDEQRPDCPSDQFAVIQNGCWLCVEPQICSPPQLNACQEAGGTCTVRGCRGEDVEVPLECGVGNCCMAPEDLRCQHVGGFCDFLCGPGTVSISLPGCVRGQSCCTRLIIDPPPIELP